MEQASIINLILKILKSEKYSCKQNYKHLNFIHKTGLTHVSHVMRKPVLAYANNKGADLPADDSKLVGNSEDWFSRDEAQLNQIINTMPNIMRKTCINIF